eukprot:1149169-Pelagomonas_calceolata.AAC.9
MKHEELRLESMRLRDCSNIFLSTRSLGRQTFQLVTKDLRGVETVIASNQVASGQMSWLRRSSWPSPHDLAGRAGQGHHFHFQLLPPAQAAIQGFVEHCQPLHCKEHVCSSLNFEVTIDSEDKNYKAWHVKPTLTGANGLAHTCLQIFTLGRALCKLLTLMRAPLAMCINIFTTA